MPSIDDYKNNGFLFGRDIEGVLNDKGADVMTQRSRRELFQGDKIVLTQKSQADMYLALVKDITVPVWTNEDLFEEFRPGQGSERK